MKTFKIILAAAMAALAMTAVSCRLEEEDVFEQSSSARMQDYIDNVKGILTANGGEWIFDAFPGSTGACAYVLDFTDKEVTAWYELETDRSCTSLYKFTYDNGPVLSFDTNNEFLHAFATPSSSLYQAKGGDYEFTILSYSDDLVKMLGKRSGNYYTLRRSDGSMTAQEYVEAVAYLSEDFRASTLEGTIGDKEVTGVVDLDNRVLSLSYVEGEGDEAETVTVEEAFIFTPDGMRLYDEMEVNGYKIDYLWYLSENNLLTNGVVTLKGKLPDDYMPYSAFEGNFTLLYYNGTRSFDVTLTPKDGGYEMSGINSNYTVFLSYDKGLGRLHWKSQVVGSNGSNSVYLCAWALGSGGSLSWGTSYGVTIHWVAENNRFEFEDNGAWSGKVVDSFILWELNSAGSSVGQYTGWGSSQIPYLTALKRR